MLISSRQLDGTGFNTCASPLTYNALPLGRHTFEVRAVDTSSNVDGTPARYTWTIDTAPETTLNGAVDGRGKSLTNGGSTPSDKVTFRFSGADNGTVAGFECRLDAGTFTSCTNPVTYTGISRGAHTFRVRGGRQPAFRDPTPATCLGKIQGEDPMRAFAYRVIPVVLILAAPLSMIVLGGCT